MACELITLKNRIKKLEWQVKTLIEKKCNCNETQDLSGESQNIPLFYQEEEGE